MNLARAVDDKTIEIYFEGDNTFVELKENQWNLIKAQGAEQGNGAKTAEDPDSSEDYFDVAGESQSSSEGDSPEVVLVSSVALFMMSTRRNGVVLKAVLRPTWRNGRCS